MTDLEKLKALLDKLPDATWIDFNSPRSSRFPKQVWTEHGHLMAEAGTIPAKLLAEAVNTLPALIAELEAARAVVEAVQAQREAVNNGSDIGLGLATDRLRATLTKYQEVTK